MTGCGTAEKTQIQIKFSLTSDVPPTFPSKIWFVVTNHTTCVMVSKTFSAMDKVFKM